MSEIQGYVKTRFTPEDVKFLADTIWVVENVQCKFRSIDFTDTVEKRGFFGLGRKRPVKVLWDHNRIEAWLKEQVSDHYTRSMMELRFWDDDVYLRTGSEYDAVTSLYRLSMAGTESDVLLSGNMMNWLDIFRTQYNRYSLSLVEILDKHSIHIPKGNWIAIDNTIRRKNAIYIYDEKPTYDEYEKVFVAGSETGTLIAVSSELPHPYNAETGCISVSDYSEHLKRGTQ